jgi:hypothetical protein
MAEHDDKKPKLTRIHIDRKSYDSPDPTTGVGLYTLGQVPAGYELFREVQGNKEDELIANNNDKVDLKQDEHFYSAQVDLNPGV